MYRVLIVDDEQPVLDSFSHVLTHADSGFETCGTARTGEEALEIMAATFPDLVLMDVNLPGIDGIDTIERARTRFPETLFVLATAYERFDIAKRAIPLNVLGYLVKPITKPKLLDQLARAKNVLDDRVRTQRDRVADASLARSMLRNQVAAMVASLGERDPDEDERKAFSEFVGCSPDYARVCVAESTLPDAAERARACAHLAKDIQFKHPCAHAVAAGRLTVLFPEGSDDGDPESLLEAVIAGQEKDEFEFGVGDRCRFPELRTSYLQALERLESSRDPQVGGRTTSPSSVVLAVLKSPPDQATKIFEGFWTEAYRAFPFDIFKAKMVAFFALISHETGSGPDPAESIIPLRSLEEWQAWSEVVFRDIMEVYRDPGSRDLPVPLREAIDFVESNYDRPLQLADAAAASRVSPAYLSRLFSAHLNIRFTDYLNRRRIDRARLLLREGQQSVKEIAYSVGIHDPNYFSRLYRKHVGHSPTGRDEGRTP